MNAVCTVTPGMPSLPGSRHSGQPSLRAAVTPGSRHSGQPSLRAACPAAGLQLLAYFYLAVCALCFLATYFALNHLEAQQMQSLKRSVYFYSHQDIKSTETAQSGCNPTSGCGRSTCFRPRRRRGSPSPDGSQQCGKPVAHRPRCARRHTDFLHALRRAAGTSAGA